MDVKNRGLPLTVFFLLLLSASFAPPFSSADQLLVKNPSPTISSHSLIFPIRGNVYPLGYYTVTLNIGNPPKAYELDIDTGSDLTWVQCDVQCKGCTLPKDKLYKPHGNLVKCSDPLCAAVPRPGHGCLVPSSQCDYQVQYADHGSSTGALVRDSMPLKSIDGSLLKPMLAFGCGYEQKYSGPTPPPSTGGVLGLGNGKIGILSQLQSLGLIRNVVGHCLSSQGGGFLFFGDKLIPPSGIVWIPIIQSSSEQHYNSGPADLFFSGRPTSVKNLQLIFDSGSSYTYFNSQAYQAIVDLVINDINKKQLKRATADPSLPICWKGANSFKSVSDVKNYFKPLALRFKRERNLQMLIPPEAYLIVTKLGNVCLGILDGTEVGLGNLNIIGDISFQDKMVIYDNERQQIGWVSSDCDRIPNMDHDFEGDFPHRYAANLGIFENQCSVR